MRASLWTGGETAAESRDGATSGAVTLAPGTGGGNVSDGQNGGPVCRPVASRRRAGSADLRPVPLGHVAERLDERLLRAREVALLELLDDGVLVGREVAAAEQAVEVVFRQVGRDRELGGDDAAGLHVDLAHHAEDRVHLAADGVGRRLGVPDEDAGAHAEVWFMVRRLYHARPRASRAATRRG